jgi:hypothetical protein
VEAHECPLRLTSRHSTAETMSALPAESDIGLKRTLSRATISLTGYIVSFHVEASMALQLRPNCEYCDKDLPADTLTARICSYECTFCANCAENILQNVCPNCGGGFAPRPIRPATEWRPGLSLAKRPPSALRVHLSYSLEDIAAHTLRIKHISAESR